MINEANTEGHRESILFKAKVLNEGQHKHAQVKRGIWGIVSTIKTDRQYLTGVEVVIEMDCLPVLRMMQCCTITDVAMLRWIAYIKSLNLDIAHISGKDNAMVDMLSRAQFRDEVAESKEGKVPED